jgi:hypothetical protein
MQNVFGASRARVFAIVLAAGALAFSRGAAADCTVDTDCPGTTCGSEICDFTLSPHACAPAGHHPAGQDGWCTQDGDCKCASLGAQCNAPFCTFTTPPAGTSGSSGGSYVPPPATGGGGGCTMVQSANTITPWGLGLAAMASCAVAWGRRRRNRQPQA